MAWWGQKRSRDAQMEWPLGTMQVTIATLMASSDEAVRVAAVEAQIAGMAVDTLIGGDSPVQAALMSAAIAEVLDIRHFEAAVRMLGTIGMGTDSLFTALDELGVDHQRFAATFERMVALFNVSVERLGSEMTGLSGRLAMVVSAVNATLPDQPEAP